MLSESAQDDRVLHPIAPRPVSRRPVSRRPFCVLLGAIATLLLGIFVQSPQARAQEAWEYSPYRIQVWLAFAPAAELPPGLQQEIVRTLEQRSDIVAGATWRLNVAPAPLRLDHDVNHALEMISFSQLTGRPEEDPDNPESSSTAARKRAEEKAAADEQRDPSDSSPADEDVLEKDKVYLLGISFDLDRFVIRVREFDSATRLWGRFVQREVVQPALLPEAAFDALVEAFTPMVRIEDAEEKLAITRLRAGSLVVDPESIVNIEVGDVLLPVVRRNNRYGEPLIGGIETIPWTFLTVEEQDGSILNCKIHSGIRRPVSGRNSVRTQRFGMLVEPKGETTQLVLKSRDVPPINLAGYEIYSKYPAEEEEDKKREAEARAAAIKAAEEAAAAEAEARRRDEEAGTTTETAEPVIADPSTEQVAEQEAAQSANETPSTEVVVKENPPVLLGRSDWRGIVEIPQGDYPIRLVYVKNGGRLLARLPIVPGLESSITVDLMNDDLRLEAEAFIAGVRSKVIDLVARRAVLTARVRSRIKENKAAEAEELMAELRTLESRRELAGLLDQQQQRFSTNDRVTQRKIDILFSDTRAMLAKFLADEPIDQLAAEVRSGQPGG